MLPVEAAVNPDRDLGVGVNVRHFNAIRALDGRMRCFACGHDREDGEVFHVSAAGLYSFARSNPNVHATASSARVICGGILKK